MVIQKYKGFTLIELMIVVAIIAILAAIAYPYYTQYKIRTNRADLQVELIRIAQRLQAYQLVNHTYSGATLAGIGGSSTYPVTDDAVYAIDLAIDGDNLGYVLTATPIATSIQADNGVLCLNQETQKYWEKGATACALSSTSSWDGR